jgi:hypothetical protein
VLAALSAAADTVRAMSNAAPWAATAGNKFREVARNNRPQHPDALDDAIHSYGDDLTTRDACPLAAMLQNLADTWKCWKRVTR